MVKQLTIIKKLAFPYHRQSIYRPSINRETEENKKRKKCHTYNTYSSTITCMQTHFCMAYKGDGREKRKRKNFTNCIQW